MIGIEQIGVYVPDGRINNLDRRQQFNVDESFIHDKIGFETLARRAPGEETSDLCVKAAEDLQRQGALDLAQVECVIVCTQNPDGAGLPHTSAIVHQKLSLPSTVAAFDISLGCSGYVYGLSVMASFMTLNRLGKGLLFTADPYSKVLDAADRNTEILFGDAATCTLMSAQARYRLGASVFATKGAGGGAIEVNPQSRLLRMNGQDVFRFVMSEVPPQVTQCLAANGLSKDNVDWFLFHQGSKYIVDNLARQLGLPPERCPFYAQAVGNTVSSSIPLLLRRVFDEAGSKVILMSGFGVGLSWATTILTRQEGECR